MRPRWRWTVGVGVSGASGLGDKLAVIVPGFVDASLHNGAWLAPSLRLGVSVLPDRVIAHPAGRGHLSRFTGRFDVCPFRADFALLTIKPCTGVELGALVARGDGVEQPQTNSSPWVAAMLGARLQLFPADWLMLEANGELGLTAVRPRFVIAPTIEVDRASLFFGTLGGSVGFRFP